MINIGYYKRKTIPSLESSVNNKVLGQLVHIFTVRGYFVNVLQRTADLILLELERLLDYILNFSWFYYTHLILIKSATCIRNRNIHTYKNNTRDSNQFTFTDNRNDVQRYT